MFLYFFGAKVLKENKKQA